MICGSVVWGYLSVSWFVILTTVSFGCNWQLVQRLYLTWVRWRKLMDGGYGMGSWQCLQVSGIAMSMTVLLVVRKVSMKGTVGCQCVCGQIWSR